MQRALMFVVLSVLVVTTFSDAAGKEYPLNENVLYNHIPRFVDRFRVSWVWEPSFQHGGEGAVKGGHFVPDHRTTRSMLLNIWRDTNEHKKRPRGYGYVMVNSVDDEIANANAMIKELRRLENEAIAAEAEYSRWLFEKQLEIWKVRVMADTNYTLQEQNRILRDLEASLRAALSQ